LKNGFNEIINFKLVVLNKRNEECCDGCHIGIVLAVLSDLVHFLSQREDELQKRVAEHIILSQESIPAFLDVIPEAPDHVLQELTSPLVFASFQELVLLFRESRNVTDCKLFRQPDNDVA
jgi:aminopeptidase-like protein